MASKLIAHLNKAIEEDSSLSVLGHQWGFDEQLVGKALQNISTLYSHYSRHDASHSKQILINIERILGVNRIANLTATDTWLILEAAYWHDIGMLVTEAEYKAASQSEEFKVFVEGIREDAHHPLHSLCSGFNIEKGTWQFDEVFPYQTVNKFKELFAEWFRGIHAARAFDTIQSPWEKCGLSSPRTELIPNRLFIILGRICEMHGSPFELIIDEQKGLAFKEVGIGTDDCHPRFIASLLRLGDLLDIDDNRFCPVMCKVAGENRPHLSKIHEMKHHSIRHFRLDTDQIDISCVCTADTFEEQIDTYLETMNWFGWLEDEIKNQMTNWTKISPSKEFGLLPTIGDIKVSFDNDNFFLPFNSRPEFSISTTKATEILQSLYKDQFSCIRELLQNSVDATLIELFLLGKLPGSNKLSDVYTNAENHKIIVTIDEINTNEEGNDFEPNFDYFNLKIKDKGCGISISDFKHMLKVGDSVNNKSKKNIIRQMKPIHKPSGTFGIGFQSIFLLTDKVSISSCSRRTHENTKVELHNPLGNKFGLCTFERLPISFEYGTELEVVIKLDRKLYRNIKLTGNGDFNLRNSNLDPIFEDNDKINKFKIFDKISEFARLSPIPIEAHYQLVDDETQTAINVKTELNEGGWTYTECKGVNFSFLITKSENGGSANKAFFYKGQQINAPSDVADERFSSFTSFNLKLNILSGNVVDWLTAERDKIRDNQAILLNDLIFEALNKYIGDNSTSSDFKFISLEVFHKLLYIRHNSSRLTKLYEEHLKDQWKAIKKINSTIITSNDGEFTACYIQDTMKWVQGLPKLNAVSINHTQLEPSKYGLLSLLGNGGNEERIWIDALVHKKTVIENNGFKFDANEQDNSMTLNFKGSSNPTKEITPNFLAYIFLRGSSNRILIPYTDDMSEFEDISIEFSKVWQLNGLAHKIPSPKVLISPYIPKNYGAAFVFKKEKVKELSQLLISNNIISIRENRCIELFEKLATYISDRIGESDPTFASEWTKLTK